MSHYIGIYIIKNKITGKLYIGQATNINGRFAQHKHKLFTNSHGNPHLQNAWNKYGPEAFEFITLELCEIEQLTEREEHWMVVLKPCGLYNCKAEGSSTKHSVETKLKIGASSKGRKHSMETRQQMSEVQKNRIFSDEHREKISKALIGRKAVQTIGFTGRTHSDESRAKTSETMKGRTRSIETKRKISEALKKRFELKLKAD